VYGQGDRQLIDHRAIIDPTAELDAAVEVAPFSIIGPNVQIGKGSKIGPHAVIKGHTRIGQHNHIFQFASVGEDPQDKKYAGEVTWLEIGDHNVIRECATINRGTPHDRGVTRIGSHNLLMAYTHVAHDCRLGDHIILANGASLGGHVNIDDHAILGGFTLVHQFCRIGAHSFCGMGSAIAQDLPPYVLVAGSPTKPHGINSKGLHRRGFNAEAIQQIKRAYKQLYLSNHGLEQAIDLLRQMAVKTPELAILVEFLSQPGRGILR
jgi:UDP-N-acetylglucosamine acyltransferase